MDNFKIIRDLTWIQESLICRATGDAQQSLASLLLLLEEKKASNHFLLIERLYVCQALLNDNQISKASSLLATVLDRELTLCMKQLNRGQPLTVFGEVASADDAYPALHRLQTILQLSSTKNTSVKPAENENVAKQVLPDQNSASSKRKGR